MNPFDVGATTNVSSGALSQATPMITASNNYQNAMQQLAMARLLNQQGMMGASLKQSQMRANNYLQSLQAGPLDWIGLGLSGIGAIKGIDARDAVKQYGYLPNPNLPVPQPTGGDY